MSNLHAWIRCMECILHISYRLQVKKWQIRSVEEKSQYEDRKKMIKRKLKEEMHILVDIPKPGFGTTNTGNVARTYYENYTTTANITGVNQELIKRLGVILVDLPSYRQISPNLFQEYAMETFNLYVTEYNWFYMPSSLHKILFHGADIIKCAGLQIGMFSEEAMEARNKDFRNIRNDHARKFSRLETMTDLFHTLLYTSDILISSISAENRKICKKHTRFDIFNDEIERLMLKEDLQDDDDSS
ncbi:uncharacterized protein LOC122403056 [Colletes gigas]|uniref:uncharacterized protein LOC122403056 n=1 Tax=Colletes gigas TaxID=935657 RepID=UPI001C9B426B|nr:uncharacterized protein LOC122403056 [Colletes gigas]